MLGNTKDIETDYKKVMHAKREIPASNCPSFVENMLYSTGGSTGLTEKEELASFAVITDRLDANAEKYETKKPKKKQESLFHKHNRLGIRGGEWCIVDTDGIFEYGGCRYKIDESETQYQPIDTEIGELYDMDKILATGDVFYDMNYDTVMVKRIDG